MRNRGSDCKLKGTEKGRCRRFLFLYGVDSATVPVISGEAMFPRWSSRSPAGGG